MREHYELGVPITRIAARNDLAVPTCRRYLMMDEKEYDEFAASQIPYMDSYREFIIDKLKIFLDFVTELLFLVAIMFKKLFNLVYLRIEPVAFYAFFCRTMINVEISFFCIISKKF